MLGIASVGSLRTIANGHLTARGWVRGPTRAMHSFALEAVGTLGNTTAGATAWPPSGGPAAETDTTRLVPSRPARSPAGTGVPHPDKEAATPTVRMGSVAG